MTRSPQHNNEVLIRLKNKNEGEYTKEDARDALNLARSTGRMEDKIFYVSVKHHARQNEAAQDDVKSNDEK